jgi:hypothetical protein
VSGCIAITALALGECGRPFYLFRLCRDHYDLNETSKRVSGLSIRTSARPGGVRLDHWEPRPPSAIDQMRDRRRGDL